MKKRERKKIYFPQVYFGFLSAFAMIMFFFILRAIIRLLTHPIYATIVSLAMYILLICSSNYYSQYNKNLRKSILISSILMWILYLATIILVER